MGSNNQKTYAANSIVNYYAQLSQLQPAEQMILDRFSGQLSQFKMLDLGVGAGRTTQHFQPKMLDYQGIDDSAEMIEACQKRFPNLDPGIFQVCDAREMSRFENHSFDFILFSFNGIDYVNHADRLRIFQEIQRLGKPGAIFCFSTHNLQGFDRILDFKSQWSLNPIATYTNLVMLAILRSVNPSIKPSILKTLPYAIVKDESHNFRLDTYYIRPEVQIAQLEPYFEKVQVYSWRNDVELVTEADRRRNTDLWLYYVCQIKASCSASC